MVIYYGCVRFWRHLVSWELLLWLVLNTRNIWRGVLWVKVLFLGQVRFKNSDTLLGFAVYGSVFGHYRKSGLLLLNFARGVSDGFADFSGQSRFSDSPIDSLGFVEGVIKNLLKLGQVFSAFRVNVVGQHILSVNSASNSGVQIAFAISVECWLSEIRSECWIWEPSCSWVQVCKSLGQILIFLLLGRKRPFLWLGLYIKRINLKFYLHLGDCLWVVSVSNTIS